MQLFRRALIVLAVTTAADVQSQGVTTQVGDRGLSALQDRDGRGMSYIERPPRRTPAGIRYAPPFQWSPWRELEPGLSARAAVDIGWITRAGNTREAYWQDYLDRSPGLLLNRFSLDLQHELSGTLAHVDGGNVHRDDHYYHGALSIPGWLRLEGRFDEFPHRTMNDAKTPFTGLGTEQLRLAQTLSAGGARDAALDELLARLPFARLDVTRQRGHLRLDLRPLDRLRIALEYRHDARNGAQAGGGALGFVYPNPDRGSIVETIEPVDFETHDLSAALSFAHRWLQLKLSYHYSLFENDDTHLAWENPFSGPESDVGQAALAPSNDWSRFAGELGVILPFNGRVTVSVTHGRAVQDEPLLAATVNPQLNAWLDPASSLSRPRANAEFTTLLFNSRLRLRPWRPLSLKAEIRYYDRDDKTDYTSFNATVLNNAVGRSQVGFYGYVPEDGYLGPNFLIPRYKAVPYGYTKWNAKAGATLRPGAATSIDFEFEREKIARDRRVREQTDEDRFRVSLSKRTSAILTARLSYEYAHRWGTDFDLTRDFAFYGTVGQNPLQFELPAPFQSGTPLRGVAELRQFDLADRHQRRFTFQTNLALGTVGDVAITGRYTDNDYNARYGLDFDRSGSANVELALHPNPTVSASVYTTFEGRRRRIKSINSNRAAVPFDFANPDTINTFDPALFGAGVPIPPRFPGLPPANIFPLDGEWRMDATLNTWALGLDLDVSLPPHWSLEVSYALLRSNEQLDLAYASPTALAFDPLAAGISEDEISDHLPELKNTDHVFEASLRYTWNERWAYRAFYRYQYSTIDDFTQQALTGRHGHFLSLGHTDGDFSASLFGLSLRVTY